MRKFLLSVLVAFFALGSAMADEVVFDFKTNDYGMTRLSGNTSEYNPAGTTAISGPITIAFADRDDENGLNGTRLWTDGMRFYKGSGFTTSISSGTITKIAIKFKSASDASKFEGEGYADGVWEGGAEKVTLSTNITSSSFTVETVTVTYTVGGEAKLAAELAFSEEEVSVVFGNDFTAPEFTKATTADVVFSSSDVEVATVDATTGAVEIVGVGTAVIKAEAAENDDYYAGVATYTIRVIDGSVVYSGLVSNADDWTFDNIELPESLTYVWKWDSSNKYLKGSAFADSKANAAQALAVSPVVDLSTRANCELTFDHAAKFQTILLDECGLMVREDGAETWTPLTIATWPEAGAWTFASSGSIDLGAYDGKKVQFALSYVSTDEAADTWEVKNFTVRGEESTAVNVIESEAGVEPVYYNLQGIRVSNPANGVFVKVEGSKTTKVLVR